MPRRDRKFASGTHSDVGAFRALGCALFFLQATVAAADVGDFVGKTIATVDRDRRRTSDDGSAADWFG